MNKDIVNESILEGKKFTRKKFISLSAAAVAAVAINSLPQKVFAANLPDSGEIKDMVDELIVGAVDTHIHGSPDVVPRRMSDNDLVQAAKEAGMAAILIKGHNDYTTSRAYLASEKVPGIKVFGGVALNNTVGGLNPYVVETQLKLGAKEIWMPTVSAVNIIHHEKGDIRKAVQITDANGKWLPELHWILEMIAKKDAILGTGHLHPNESEKLINFAQSKGVKRILLTHPEFELTKVPIEMQQRLVRKGVFFERCFYSSNPSPYAFVPVKEIAAQIKAVGVESTILATDFGQKNNDEPVVGMKRFIKGVISCGFDPKDIETMVKTNPARLLGL